MSQQPDFRAAVVEAMARRGLNAKRLADESGVGYASVHGYVTGTGGLTADNLSRLCGTLGIGVKLPRADPRKENRESDKIFPESR